MKSRIIEIIDKEYGEQTAKWYDVQYFKRDWNSVILWILFPIVGWIAFFTVKPYKIKWRTEVSLGTKKQAEYYLKKEEKAERLYKLVKGGLE